MAGALGAPVGGAPAPRPNAVLTFIRTYWLWGVSCLVFLLVVVFALPPTIRFVNHWRAERDAVAAGRDRQQQHDRAEAVAAEQRWQQATEGARHAAAAMREAEEQKARAEADAEAASASAAAAQAEAASASAEATAQKAAAEIARRLSVVTVKVPVPVPGPVQIVPGPVRVVTRTVERTVYRDRSATRTAAKTTTAKAVATRATPAAPCEYTDCM